MDSTFGLKLLTPLADRLNVQCLKAEVRIPVFMKAELQKRENPPTSIHRALPGIFWTLRAEQVLSALCQQATRWYYGHQLEPVTAFSRAQRSTALGIAAGSFTSSPRIHILYTHKYYEHWCSPL
ncbi:hypothetical protein SRHO_G00115140 [Serrasalmus rhombeus]